MSKATTKFAIAFAFKELLLEKSIDKITINDITEKCGINRQTFYYHFHDIYELIEWICETDADHVLKQNKTYDTWQEGFLAIFHLLKKDEPFVVNIYHNAPRGYIYRYLYKVTYQLIYDVLEEKAAGMVVREEDKTFIADFYKYGFVGLVLEWIDKGMKEDPKQIIEIRDLIKELGKNHTVILSSHILSEISAVCDHIFIISKGKLVASDSTENLMKQMSGAQEIELLIKGDNAAVQEVLTQIAEVEKCIPLEQKDEACAHLNLIAKPGMDIREQVFASCVNHGFVILQMNPVSKSLEDVFLELTEKEGTQKEVLPEKKLHFVKSHFGKESKEDGE